MRLLLTLLLLAGFPKTSNAVVCQSLFGNPALYQTIHALAELRLELDLAQTSNDDSITISVLMHEYAKKEKSILKYISRKDLLKLMKLEIEEIQKKASILNDDRKQEKKLIEDYTPGFKARFYKIKPGTTDVKPFELMSTPVTQIIWKDLSQLMISKGVLRKTMDLTPSISKSDLFPVGNISFKDVMEWIRGINDLSANGNDELTKFIRGHQRGDIYRLPSRKQWEALFREIEPNMYPKIELLSANHDEDVATRAPVMVQQNPFLGLGTLSYFMSDYQINGDEIKIQLGHSYLSSSLFFPSFMNIEPDDNSNYLTFRLVRERKQP